MIGLLAALIAATLIALAVLAVAFGLHCGSECPYCKGDR